jgi:hypothetical protein
MNRVKTEVTKVKTKVCAEVTKFQRSTSSGKALSYGAVLLALIGVGFLVPGIESGVKIPSTLGNWGFGFLVAVLLFVGAWLLRPPWKNIVEDAAKGIGLATALWWFAGQPEAAKLSHWGTGILFAAILARTIGASMIHLEGWAKRRYTAAVAACRPQTAAWYLLKSLYAEERIALPDGQTLMRRDTWWRTKYQCFRGEEPRPGEAWKTLRWRNEPLANKDDAQRRLMSSLSRFPMDEWPVRE